MDELEKKYKFKLTIITVNLNNKDGLQKTIDSVINQTCKDFEWIVIDGGSSDGSKELIEKYQDHIDYWVSEPDKGIYNAMNKGIIASNGEYLLFLNSGDILFDKFVLSKVLKEFKGYDFYVGDELQNGKIHSIKLANYISEKEICDIFNFSFFPHQSTFIKSSIFEKYGMYREDFKFASDKILFLKSILLGNAKVNKLPFIISIFEGGGNSSNYKNIYANEIELFFNEIPRINYLLKFNGDYKELIDVINNSKFFNLLYKYYYKKYWKRILNKN